MTEIEDDNMRMALRLAAGAIEAAVAAGVVSEATVVRFTDGSAGLGDRTIGDILDICDTALGRKVTEPLPIAAPSVDQHAFRVAGYTGDQCSSCHSMRMKRNGSCLVCEECGTTTGCS